MKLDEKALEAAMTAGSDAVALAFSPSSKIDTVGAARRHLASAYITAYLTAIGETHVLVPRGEGWRDIATAPKDGSAVLLFIPFDETPIKGKMTTGFWEDNGWHLCDVGNYAEGDDVYGAPTHWMPLPPPPAIPVKEG